MRTEIFLYFYQDLADPIVKIIFIGTKKCKKFLNKLPIRCSIATIEFLFIRE